MLIGNPEGLVAQKITTYGEVLENWPLFVEGLGNLNDIGASKGVNIKPETLLRLLLDCVVDRPTESIIYIVRSKNHKPLAYIIGFDSSDRYHEGKNLLIYAIYSNRKSKTASRFAFSSVEEWARREGYDCIQAFSPRTSGAFMRLVRRFFGMDLKLTFFSKSL